MKPLLKHLLTEPAVLFPSLVFIALASIAALLHDWPLMMFQVAFLILYISGQIYVYRVMEIVEMQDEVIETADRIISTQADMIDKHKEAEETAIDVWFAADSNGHVYLYFYRPLKGDTYWLKGSGGHVYVYRHQLPKDIDPKWEDEEPVPAKIVIIGRD